MTIFYVFLFVVCFSIGCLFFVKKKRKTKEHKIGLMHKIPFFIGNIASWFVPGCYNRRFVRGHITRFFFYIPIARFVKQTYGVRIKSIKFVRQASVSRMICVVNDHYFVKVFRNTPIKRLNDCKFLLDFIRPHLNVNIPDIIVAKNSPMYVCERLPGKVLYDFNIKDIIRHQKKIRSQIFKIIDDLHSISIKKIPNDILQRCDPIQKNKGKPVLIHGDVSVTNILLDQKYNIISVIDWDGLQVSQQSILDRGSFEYYWDLKIAKKRK